MPTFKSALFICAVALAGCASGPQKGAGPVIKIDVASQSETILADARKKKAEKGCDTAIPSYRVVASFGKGHDTAQYELGACLLEARAETASAETLLREEGAFWLRRAAYAGNARAQLALASALSGSLSDRQPGIEAEIKGHAGAGLAPNLVEGFGWSLIYADNAAHKLYGLPELHPVTADHFRNQMTPAMISEANAFAAAFRTIEMEVFTPPQLDRAQRRNAFPQGYGQKRRRRQ